MTGGIDLETPGASGVKIAEPDTHAKDITLTVLLGFLMALISAGAVLLVVLQDPEYDAHTIVALIFLAGAMVPAFSSIIFAIGRWAYAGIAHMAIVTSVTVVICCGLLTNIRVFHESEMSHYCEERRIAINCRFSTDLATFLTIAMLFVTVVLGTLSCYYSHRVYLHEKARPRTIVYHPAPPTPSASPGIIPVAASPDPEKKR